MKKFFLLIIMAFILSSCGADETAPNPSTSSPASFPAPAEPNRPEASGSFVSESGSASATEPRYETVSLMYYGGSAESDPLSESVLERFGIKIKLIPYPEDYSQLLASLSSGPPDMFMLVLSPARLAELTGSGYVREIPDEMVASNANLNAYVQGNAIAQANRQIYNAYAYLPCDYDRSPVYSADSARFFYRKDWAKTLSLAEPEDPGDLYTMAAAFAAQQNPNRTDGSALTGLAADSVKRFAALYGFDLDGWVEEGGRRIPAYYSDGMLPMLGYARRLHDEGLLKFIRDAEAYANLNDAGMLVTRADSPEALAGIIEPVAERLDVSVEDALENNVGIMEPPRDPNGQKAWGNGHRQEGWMIGRHVTDGTLERILSFLDYTLTDEARVSSRYGLPGVTYTQNENGIFMFTDPETYAAYNLNTMYPTGGFLNLLVNDASREADVNSPSPVPYPLRCFFDEAARKYYAPVGREDALCRSVNSPLRDSFPVDYENSFYNIITGTEPADVMFEQFKDSCRQNGIETMIEEVSALIN